jgi:hypothetical protein
MSDRPTDELRDQLKAVLEAGISDEAMKPIQRQIDNICRDVEDTIFYRVKDELSVNLSAYVVDMAKRSVEAILAGNESELRRYLSCEINGWTGRDHKHPVIHGRLFEAQPIELRRKIVEAHRDLIANERILDLEDQVKSLVQQVNKITAEKKACLSGSHP